jgi:hypothetical protein
VKTALHVLSWILYAREPLQLNELNEAILLSDEHAKPGDEEFKSAEIEQICEGFVVHDKTSRIVRFIHGTVQRFLEEYITNPKHSDISSIFLSHADLAKACLTYLRSPVFDEPCSGESMLKERLKTHRFSTYAAHSWGFHAKKGAERSPIPNAVVETLKSPMNATSILQIDLFKIRGYFVYSSTTLLHVIAMNGLATTCRLLLNINNGYVPMCL